MTNYLVWRVYLCSTWLSDNMVTVCNKQNFICYPFLQRTPFRARQYCIPFLRLRAEFRSVLYRELVFLPSKHLTVSVSGGIMSQPCKRPRLLQPGEISELIFDTDSDEARLSSDVSSVHGLLKACQSYHNLNLTAKQPVVTSPAVQFCPVPLSNRMFVRMGHVNRLNRQ